MLFLSASVGEGHTAAAQAVSNALQAGRSDYGCEIVDSYRYASEVFHRVASNGYIGMVKVLPQLYRVIYEQAERATQVSAFKKWLHRYTALNLRHYVTQLMPDAIVCTHAFPCGVMSEYKREFSDAPAVVGVVTDFVVHPFWIHRNIDAYAVATSAMRQTLISRGVRPDRVTITGIPIDERFGLRPDRAAMRRALGLAPDRITLLLMGGGVGIGPLEKAIVGIDRLAHDVQTVVVVGKNPSLERRLAETARTLDASGQSGGLRGQRVRVHASRRRLGEQARRADEFRGARGRAAAAHAAPAARSRGTQHAPSGGGRRGHPRAERARAGACARLSVVECYGVDRDARASSYACEAGCGAKRREHHQTAHPGLNAPRRLWYTDGRPEERWPSWLKAAVC